MMMYGVIGRDLFEMYKDDSDDFYYEAHSESISYVHASNKEEAARMYISSDYDEISIWAEELYNEIMRDFITYTIYGDAVLENYTRQTDVDMLISQINEFIDEYLIKEVKPGDTNNNDFISVIPGDVDVYITMIQDKFPDERLIELLTPEEIKEIYIRFHMSNVMVIPLEELE